MSIRGHRFAQHSLPLRRPSHLCAEGLLPIEANSIYLARCLVVALLHRRRDGFRYVMTLAEACGNAERVVSVSCTVRGVVSHLNTHTRQVRSKAPRTATACASPPPPPQAKAVQRNVGPFPALLRRASVHVEGFPRRRYPKKPKVYHGTTRHPLQG